MVSKQYRLTPAALHDLENIWAYSARAWSAEQGDRYISGLTLTFELIAENPDLARERHEYAPPVRIYRYKSHIIIYLDEGDYVSVIRVRHGNEDWSSDPTGEM